MGTPDQSWLAQRGFRLPLEIRPSEGIVGRALASDEVVQGGPGLGGPDALLEQHGLGAALAIPVPDHAGLPLGALLVARRRPVPFEPDTIGALVVAAARLGESLETRPAGPREDAVPTALFESLDPSRAAAAVASAARARLGADAAAVLWPEGDGFVLAGGVGLPEGATAPAGSPTVTAVAETREPVVAVADAAPDAELARCLGATPRAVLPLSVDEWLIAVLALGSARPCGTVLSPVFTRAAAVALRNARLHAESRGTAGETPADAEPPPIVGTDAGAAPLGDMASLLAVVLGRLAAVRDRVGDHEAARDLVHAEEAAWRVAEGIRRVLGFAPRPGAQPPSPVDVGAAVRDSVRATERLWASEGAVPAGHARSRAGAAGARPPRRAPTCRAPSPPERARGGRQRRPGHGLAPLERRHARRAFRRGPRAGHGREHARPGGRAVLHDEGSRAPGSRPGGGSRHGLAAQGRPRDREHAGAGDDGAPSPPDRGGSSSGRPSRHARGRGPAP